MIVGTLAVWGIFDPGKGGFNFASFNPGNVANWSGFSLAVVFSIQGYTGWDGAAPLAEETADPKRNVPRAVIGSILILGAFLVLDVVGHHARLGHVGHRHAAGVAGAAGPRARPPLLVERLGAPAARDVQLGGRGQRLGEQRLDAHVVLDGARRRAAEVPDEGAPGLPHADERDPAAVRPELRLGHPRRPAG